MWGRRALERRGRETSGSLEQRKRPALRGGRRPPPPGPGRPKGSERSTDGDAGEDGPRERALPYELRYLATTLMRSANRRSLRPVYPDFVCANGRDGRVLAAWKALRRFCRGRTAAMRNAREDRPQSKNDARPGGIAARYDHGEAVPRRNGFKSELAGLTDCWLLMTGRPAASLHDPPGCSRSTEAESE